MSVDALIERCRSGDPDAQIDAALRLRDLGAESAAADVARLLASPDAVVRETAASVLGVLGGGDRAAAGRALVTALGDREPLVRSGAADALGMLRVHDALPQLRHALSADPEPLVRASAAESLGDLVDAAALPELVGALDDEDDAVRGYAANAIGLIGDAGALGELDAALAAGPSAAFKAELLGARHRLGAPGSRDDLLALAAAADADSADELSNLLEDLARTHPDLAGVAESVRARRSG